MIDNAQDRNDPDVSTDDDWERQIDMFLHDCKSGRFSGGPLTFIDSHYSQKLGYAANLPHSQQYEPPSFKAFPVEIFPAGLKEFCLEVARYANADPSIPAVSLLGVVAALIGSTHRICYGSDSQPSILWSVVVVPSSECKSRAMAPIIKPLSRADDCWDVENKKLMAEFIREYDLYEKQRSAWKKDTKNSDKPFGKEPPKRPPKRRIIVRGTTTDALCGILQDNPCGVLVTKDELGELFGEMSASSSSAKGKNEAFYSASFNGDAYTVDRKHAESYRLSSTAISIVGGIQPKVLKRILAKNPNLTDSGMMIRPIFTMPPLLPDSADEVFIADEAAEKYDKLIMGLLALREAAVAEPITVTLSPAAKAIYKAFLTMNGDERNPMGETLMRAYCGRMRGTILRMALVLHVIGQIEAGHPTTDPVPGETMIAAVAIAEWCKYEFCCTFTALGVQLITGDPDEVDILAIIDKRKVATVRDIQRSLTRFRCAGGAERVTAILWRLAEREEVTMEVKKSEGTGRPPIVYRRT